MSPACRRLVAGGGAALAILLPLWFNPFAAATFEPPKVTLFLAVTASMVLARSACALLGRAGIPGRQRARAWIAAQSRHNLLLLPACAYAAAHILATLTSPHPARSFWGAGPNPHGTITTLSLVTLFLLMTEALAGPEERERLVTAFLWGRVPVAIYGLAQYLGLDPLEWLTSPVPRAFSTLGNTIYLGAYLAMAIPFTLARLVSAAGWGEALRYGLVLALQVGCLRVTFSRGAWLALLGAALLFLGYLAWQRRSKALLLVALLVLLEGGWRFAAMSGLDLPLPKPLGTPGLPGTRADTRLARDQAASMGARLAIWRGTLALLPGRWPLGYGPESYAEVFSAHYPPEFVRYQPTTRLVDDPHNIFLEHLISAGIAGLLALLSLLGAFLWGAARTLLPGALNRSKLTLAAAASSVVAFLVATQFNPDVIVLSAFFWLDLALGVAAMEACRQPG